MRRVRFRFEHIEPVWWGLFGAGGVLAAMVLPGLLVLLLLSGWLPALDVARLPEIEGLWFLRLGVHLLVSALLFHSAHRIYHGMHDLLLPTGWVARALTYGLAIAYLGLVVFDLSGALGAVLGT
ncbi:MAG: fumarate reductase subunit D [Deltaproteobacteria bacterium]|nr:MAG: fumarate reductase subunit D [Deltaproteobacteria bacterium]